MYKTMEGKKIIQELLEYIEMKSENASFSKIEKYFLKLSTIDLNKSEADLLAQTILKYIDLVINISSNKEYRPQIKFCRKWLNVILKVITERFQSVFMKRITRRILEILIEEDASGWCIKKELLRVFMVCIQNVPKEIKQNATKELPDIYLFKIVDSISTYGDFDFQVNLIELVFRIYGKNVIVPKLTELLPESEELSESFAKITGDTFDEDVRNFLNRLNKTSGKVFSIICKDVFIAHTKCGEPIEGIGGLWVDFNLSENAVSFYCTKKPLVSGSPEDDDPLWDREMFFVSDVDFVRVDRLPESNETVVYVKLTVACINSHDDVLDTMAEAKDIKFVISYGSDKLTTLLSTILPNMFKHKFQHNSVKVSLGKKSVYKPLKISVFKRARFNSSKTKSDIVSFTNRVEPLVSVSDTSSTHNISRKRSTSSASTRHEVISISDSSSCGEESCIGLVPSQTKMISNAEETQYKTEQICLINHMQDMLKVSHDKLGVNASLLHNTAVLSDNSSCEEPQRVQILSGRCSGSKRLQSSQNSLGFVSVTEESSWKHRNSDHSDHFETAQESIATSNCEVAHKKNKKALKHHAQEKEEHGRDMRKVSAPITKPSQIKELQKPKSKEKEKELENLERYNENIERTTQSSEHHFAKDSDEVVTVIDTGNLASSENQQKSVSESGRKDRDNSEEIENIFKINGVYDLLEGLNQKKNAEVVKIMAHSDESQQNLVPESYKISGGWINENSFEKTENLHKMNEEYDLLEGLSQKYAPAVKEAENVEVVEISHSGENRQNAVLESDKNNKERTDQDSSEKMEDSSEEKEEIINMDGNNSTYGTTQSMSDLVGVIKDEDEESDVPFKKKKCVPLSSSTTDSDTETTKVEEKITMPKEMITDDSNNVFKKMRQKATTANCKEIRKKMCIKQVNKNSQNKSKDLHLVDKHLNEEVLPTKTADKVNEQTSLDKQSQSHSVEIVIMEEDNLMDGSNQEKIANSKETGEAKDSQQSPEYSIQLLRGSEGSDLEMQARKRETFEKAAQITTKVINVENKLGTLVNEEGLREVDLRPECERTSDELRMQDCLEEIQSRMTNEDKVNVLNSLKANEKGPLASCSQQTQEQVFEGHEVDDRLCVSVSKQRLTESNNLVETTQNPHKVENNEKGNKTLLNKTLSTTLRSQHTRRLFNQDDSRNLKNMSVFVKLNSTVEEKTAMSHLEETAEDRETPRKRVYRKKRTSYNTSKSIKAKSRLEKSKKLRVVHPCVTLPLNEDRKALRVHSAFLEVLESFRKEVKTSFREIIKGSSTQAKSAGIEVRKESKKGRRSTRKYRDVDTIVKEHADPDQLETSSTELRRNPIKSPEKKINIISNIQIRPKRILLGDNVTIPPKKVKTLCSDSVVNQEIPRWIETGGSTDYNQVVSDKRAIFKFLYPAFENFIRNPDESNEYRVALSIWNILKEFSD